MCNEYYLHLPRHTGAWLTTKQAVSLVHVKLSHGLTHVLFGWQTSSKVQVVFVRQSEKEF